MSSNDSIPITALGSIVAAAPAWAVDGRAGATLVVKATFVAAQDGGVMTLAGPDPIVAGDAHESARVVRSGGARPGEQPMGELRGDEWIDLEGPPRLRCRLPGVRASALVHGLASGGPHQVELRPEVLRVDDARRRCALTFRASIALPADVSPGALRVVAALGLHGAPPMLPGAAETSDDLDDTAVRSDPREPAPSRDVDSTVAIEPAHAAARPVVPFVSAPPGSSSFAQASGSAPAPRATDGDADGTLALDPEAADRLSGQAVLPFGHAAAAPPPAAPAAEPAAAPPVAEPPAAPPAGATPGRDPAPPAAPATAAEKRPTSWATVAESEKVEVTPRAPAAPQMPQKPNLKGAIYGDFIRRGKR